MTVVVTRNLPARFRGFLASCMLEIAPGVYTAPRMTVAVRERIWLVLEEWWELVTHPDSGIVMTWVDPEKAGGQEVRVLGSPPIEMVDHDGIYLARKPWEEDEPEKTKEKDGSLTTQ